MNLFQKKDISTGICINHTVIQEIKKTVIINISSFMFQKEFAIIYAFIAFQADILPKTSAINILIKLLFK